MKNAEQLKDIEVIRKILAGEAGWFEIVIRRYNPFLYKIGRSYDYDHEDTKDLMQDTFIDAYTNLAKLENRSSLKTWIIKIMLNHCYRKRQKLSYKNETATDITDSSMPLFSTGQHNDTNTIILKRELKFIIENALKQLPLDYRLVFSLREMNGLSVKEAAEILNISAVNVKVRLNRAKTMLKKEIEKYYKAEEIFEFNLIYCDEIVSRVMDKINCIN